MSTVTVSIVSNTNSDSLEIGESKLGDYLKKNGNDEVVRVDHEDGTTTYCVNGDEFCCVEDVISARSAVELEINRLQEEIVKLGRERVLLSCVKRHMDSAVIENTQTMLENIYYSESESESDSSSSSDSSDSESDTSSGWSYSDSDEDD